MDELQDKQYISTDKLPLSETGPIIKTGPILLGETEGYQPTEEAAEQQNAAGAAQPSPINAQQTQQQAQPKQPDAWDTFFATLQEKQAYNKQVSIYNRGVELDRELYNYAVADNGEDQEKSFTFYDDWVKQRYGIRGEKGRVFNEGKLPFTDSRDYRDLLVRTMTQGYKAFDDDILTKWMGVQNADRETKMKVAGIDPYTIDLTSDSLVAVGLAAPKRRLKTDEEIDQELAEYNAKVMSRHFIMTYKVFDDAYHFSDEEREVIEAALRNGDGLPKDMEDAYLRATGGDPERMAIINHMIDMSRKKEPWRWEKRHFWKAPLANSLKLYNRVEQWKYDIIWQPLSQTVVDFFNGARETEEDIATSIILQREIRSQIKNSPNAAKFYWNEEERTEYERLCTEYERIGENKGELIARNLVNEMCVKRLVDEAKPHEVYLQERRERLFLREATMHKPTVEYAWYNNALAGAVSSVPYMAATISPVGFIANVNSQFQSVRDGLILRGEDPDKAVGLQIAGAVIWAGIEKAQLAHGFGKPLTGLERKTILMRILDTAWKDGKLKIVGQAGLAYAKEVGVKTAFESGEEALQRMAQTGLESYLAKGFTMQILYDMLNDGTTEYFQSMPSMFFLSLAGGGISMARANRTAINTDSLVAYAAKQNRALNTFKGTLFNPEAGKSDADLNKQTQAFKKDCEEIWENHRKDGSGGVAALNEIRDKYTLSQKEAEIIGDWLDARTAGLEAAKWADTQEQADFAAWVFDGLPIGNNTTYNIENFFHLIAPNAKVERTEITDPNYVPKTDNAPSKAPTDEKIASLERSLEQIRQKIAAMPDNAKRRKNEYELKKREKQLNRYKAAQERAKAAQAEEDARTPKKAITRVTVPVGKSGETRTFTIQEDYGSPDINTPSFAVSVSVAMQGAVGITFNKGTKDEFVLKDGTELSDADFAALPWAEKLKYALTEKQYLALTPEERDAYVDEYQLGAGGDFRILDEHGKQVFGSDGLITIMRAIGGRHVAVGGNKTLAHEYGHAITRFARDLGLVTDADAEVMRQLFGAPREGVDELWNEEAANDAFAEYLRGQYDFRRFTEEERRAAMNIFQRIWDAIKSLFRQNGYEPPEVQHEINERKRAEAVAFEGMKSGDFSGLAPWAGIKFAKDEKKAEGGKANDSQNQRPNTGKETQNEARTVANEKSAQPKQDEPRGQEEAKAPQQTPTATTTTNLAQNEQAATKPTVSQNETPTANVSAKTNENADTNNDTNTDTNANESDEYMRGFQAGLAQAGANPTLTVANKPVRAGAKRTVFTPGYQMSAECETMWVSLDDLIESTDDREIQMRDRNRIASDIQVLEKTRKGVFQPLALFPGTKSDDGAPIVGGGLRIISGHGRKRMLQVLAQEGRYNEYLDAINAECKKQGIPTAPAGMKNPVLVLRVTGGLENRAALVKFAELSNRWGGLKRSVVELAESDARQITPEMMRLYAPDASGNLLAASNREFMAAFIKAVGAEDLTRGGDYTPTADAALRVQRALMAKLFGDDESTRSMISDIIDKAGDLGLGNLQNALMKSAGQLIALKNGRASYDIVDNVHEAVMQYIEWRAALKTSPRLTLAEHFMQGDIFAETSSQMTQNLAKLFEIGRFGAVLERYAKLAAAQDVDAQTTFFERATPLQILAQAERDIVEKDENGNPVAPYVTPDPNSAEAAVVEQTPPVVQYEPEPSPKADSVKPVTKEEAPAETVAPVETTEEAPSATEENAPSTTTESNNAVAVAEQTLTPLAEDAPFIPAPAVRGTATIPQAKGTPELHFIPVNAKGEPIGKERKLKVGAYNLLRSPYSANAITKPSTQDKAGRGLGIFCPPKATDSKGRYWGEIFPHFQGNKTEMADRTSQAIRKNMSKAERAHYKTIVDYFGGGGCWGLYHALTNFENANELIINEYEADRIAKIQLLHEIDGEVADIARTILFNPERHERLRKSLENVKEKGSDRTGSSSPLTIANHAKKLFEKELTNPRERAAFCAFLDCAKTMRGSEKDKAGNVIRDLDIGLEKALATIKEDGRKAKEAADAFKARGGKITYHAGDALKFDTKMGDDVVAVCDPPYYLTQGYDGEKVPLDAEGKGWDYKSTHALMMKLIDNGSAIVYTDEAWWYKEDYKYSYDTKQEYRQAEFFTSDFDTENGILLDFINGFDHFDVAGRVASRQETLGIHHGHTIQTNAESNGGTNSGNADTRFSVTRRSGSDRPSLFNVAPIPARESRHTGRTRTSRGRSSRGEQALARAVIAANSAATEPRYSVSRLYTGSGADYDQPSLHAIGTGEGAQAYGWGLYASDRRDIGENYARQAIMRYGKYTVKRKGIELADKLFNKRGDYARIFGDDITSYLVDLEASNHASAGMVIRKIKAVYSPREADKLIKYFLEHKNEYTFTKNPPRTQNLYEQTFFTDRPEGDESRLLNWYGRLTDFQKKLLAEELGTEAVEDMDDLLGSEVYETFVDIYGSPEAASKQLAAIGIDGVKYPAMAYFAPRNRDGRRGYNYVSFRDDNIRVDHKWTDGQQRFSVRTPWQEGFPKAVCMTTRAALMAKYGDRFEKAKSGGVHAAINLVKAVAKPEKIRELLAAHPNASIVAPVLAQEKRGRNKIPLAFAKYIAKAGGLKVDEGIMQTVRANHTGANAAHRLFAVPEFTGDVKAGAEYIVVDDHITQGGTVNALRDHIESHGGKVVAIASLTLSHGSSIISPTKEIVDEVRRKHEGIDETLREYGIADSVECLTQSQCRYLASLSPNTLGDRINATRVQGSLEGNGRAPSGRSAVREVAKDAPRQSVRRMDPNNRTALTAVNQAGGYLANRILGGKQVTIDEAEELLNGLGITNYSPAEVLQKANTIANYAKNNLREKVARQRPDLSYALAQVGMQMSMQEALDAAITGTAAKTDPLVGRLVQKAIQSKQRRDLEAAKGFTAAEMLARLPISLTEQFLAVAEFERSPEEAERLEKARQKREEERKAAEMADTRSDDERLADFESAEVRDATPEEREAIDALLNRAKAAVQAQKAVEAAQRAAKKKAEERKKAQEENADAADADENGAGGGLAEDEDFNGLTQEHIRRIAPIFEDEHIFAQFLIEWTADAIREKHPELPSTRELWKSPVAIRELKQTATHILRRLASDILGNPTNSHARNFADHIINELESDASCTTFNAVRRKIAHIYDAIHTDGLRMSRKEQMKRLIDGWREKDPTQKGKYITHEGIRQLVGAKGRFSSTAEEADRTTDGRTEMYGRMLIRVLEMSPEKLEARKTELEKIVNAGVDAENLGDLPTTTKVRLAADELAAIAKYGNLARELPGRIADAAAEILEDLGGKRQAFEQKRMEREAANKEIIDTLIAAITDTPAPRRKKEKGRTARYLESFQGNIQLELQNLIRYCRDPKKREAALYVIENLTAGLSEGTSRYRAVKMRHQEAINKALKACYGDAAKGVNHLLTEPIPDEVAAQVFGQNRGQVATYGHLLQLYASIVQGDYAENSQRYGRDKQLALIKQTLTDADMRFYDFAVEWYRANREELSQAVEEVTGVPITSPDPLYVPVRVAKPKKGLLVNAVAWSPIPRALSMRVPHGYDFNEGANFFRLLDEQAEIHAQTVGYSALGIMLRDTICSAEVQDAVRRNVDKADMTAVTSHLTDILAQDAAKPEDTRILDAITYARAWIARFAISGNVSSALAQPASIPVWANIMLGKHQVGFARIAYYMTHIDREAVKDLVNSDGYKARYKMGWSEEVQNAILHPSRSRIMSKLEGLYDKGMLLSQAADKAASLWIAQGFYRDAQAEFLRRGDAPDLAKRKALALTWAAVEATQQTGRTEYLNAAQRGSSKVAKVLFQFRTAQLLSNNYLIQALREVKAGTPGAKGRLIRAVAINTIVVPAYLSAVHFAWEALLGQEPPEDEDEWPQYIKDFVYSMVDNTTAPLFFVSSIASAGSKALLGLETYGHVDSGIPAVDSSLRLGGHAFDALKDAAAYLAQEVGGAEFETELTADKIWADILRLGRDTVAPIRHGYRAYQGWTQED